MVLHSLYLTCALVLAGALFGGISYVISPFAFSDGAFSDGAFGCARVAYADESPGSDSTAESSVDDTRSSTLATAPTIATDSREITPEISAEGTSATAPDFSFDIADFSRIEKGSNRPIGGVYHGYAYLMDGPAESLTLIATDKVIVVYVPPALLDPLSLSLDNPDTIQELITLLTALDDNASQGNKKLGKKVPWLFTSETHFTHESVTYSFSQEYEPGYWYTSVQGADGSDITNADNPHYLHLGHVDYATLQPHQSALITKAPTGLEAIGLFFTHIDYSPLWVTLKTTGTALVIIFILGLLAAWWSLRLSPRAQDIADAILTIPMVLPPTVCGFLLLLLLGRNTPIGNWFDQIGFPLVFSWPATVIAAVVVAFPLMYRSARGAFENLDPYMLDAARTLGWGEGKIFIKLMLPLAWSSIAAGTMLAFARALGEFGATLFVAGNYVGITRTIPIAIYFEWMSGNIDVALFWTVIVMIVSFAAIFVINVWSRRTTKYRQRGGQPHNGRHDNNQDSGHNSKHPHDNECFPTNQSASARSEREEAALSAPPAPSASSALSTLRTSRRTPRKIPVPEE